jgi:threonine dehydrogenase-like Zn-dependent dehydrogenase
MTICGSNLYLSDETMTYMHDSVLLSHEFMGVIARVADHVNNLKVGQRVVVAFNIACGNCEYCKSEEYSLCDITHSSKLQGKLHEEKKVTRLGYSYLKNEVIGAQPEYIRVPFADINCLPIPDDVSDEKGLYLSDIIPTAYHGCQIGNVKQSSTVTIWGLGPVGLLQER